MKQIEDLTQVLSKLKGIGKKNATRIAFDLLTKDSEEIDFLLKTIKDSYYNTKICKICNSLSNEDICEICKDEKRDHSIICVVEDTRSLFAFNKASSYKGLYHVLGGKIDPLNGKGIEDLNFESLKSRINENVKEIILALNPDLEGETTILYLTKILSQYNIKITRIASGIPIGGNIEFSDSATLIQSLEGRIKMNDLEDK